VIPARGGSKGIPEKNIKPVCGKPLLAWSIEQALASKSVDKVIVSTDCDKIATVAWEYDAEVFIRSPETATDTASSESALLEALRQYPGYQACVFLQATSPIRQPKDIDNCVELVESYCDSVFSARVVEGYTWSQGCGMLRANYTTRQPRQQWDSSVLEENGSIYAFRTGGFLDAGVRIFGRTQAYQMHALDSYQVDEPADLDLIENLMRLRLDSFTTV